MKPLYLLTAVDVRRAEVAGDTRKTTIVKMVIPAITFMTASHNPGGGHGAVDFLLPRINAVEPSFEAKGFDRSVFGVLGKPEKWTFAGALRDKKTGADIPARAVIEGAIAEWTPDDTSPEEFLGCNHAIKEVTHYEFSIDGEELWYWDFWESELRTKGQSYTEGIRGALGA
ncbi:phage major tail tube protein [Amorphus orientalis]|uniref:Phage tail tube protein FII n=1 Tax=Amorphus orientalis TaxID=649198 RepID=A0AAE3VLU8_9HYPH|nr:phage major tail tube protein [Amorphus orientalis]MDQ0314859.1 phage tail tube protein FII [Amorphus orientalis]